MTEGNENRTDQAGQGGGGAPDPWAAPPEGRQAGQHQAPPPRSWAPPAPSSDKDQRGGGRRPAQPRGPRAPGHRSAAATVGLMLTLLGLLSFSDPYLGLAFGLGGAVLGVFGLLEARRAGAFSASAVTALAVGSAVAVLSLLVLVASLVPAQRDYQDCRERAITRAGTLACNEEFKERGLFDMGR